MKLRSKLSIAALVLAAVTVLTGYLLRPFIPGTADLDAVRTRVIPQLENQLAERGLDLSAPVFIRIFKASSELELWIKNGDEYTLFKTYPICSYSGELGPKLKEGDGQSPEGFYSVATDQLNPNSSYHLSFNIGFPNRFDRAHERTGSFLMVHGKCVSIGCYAMTDAGIEEIYLLAEAALKAGQESFDVHIFPFRMTDGAMTDNANSEWIGFWQNLKQGHDLFEARKNPPSVDVTGKSYTFKSR